MTTFVYFANKDGYQSKLLAKIQAESILIADKQFEKETGENPITSKLKISVSIINK